MTSVWGASLSLLGVAFAPASIAAQSASPARAAAERPSSPTPAGRGAAPSPTEPPGFTYDPEGRRDPFVSLLGRVAGARDRTVTAQPPGLAGLEVADLTLRGTLQTREGFVAILQGADRKTYIVRAGDTLFDGTVRTISQNDVVILQQADDQSLLEKPREIRKVLRQAKAD